MEKLERMNELVVQLTAAAKAYYAEDREMMSNFTYDQLYEELQLLEKETGIVMAKSPTITVGYEAVDELPKQKHESVMLSLDKTKEREELKDWLKGKEGILSWKLDGLTIVLTYDHGSLETAVTRGNGEIGEVITNNAKVFMNLPLSIPFSGKLVLRGEAAITYTDFEQINAKMEEGEERYKNPRNLCSGSVRQLNNAITAERRVGFYAFSLVKAEEKGEEKQFGNSREQQLLFLASQGFALVDYEKVSPETVVAAVEKFSQKAPGYPLPSDGLVLTFEDIEFGRSLGRTAKFPRDAIAFKWADEVKETNLLRIEWSPSRTGLINPIAIFEPVELEGTTVSRASVHNISIVRNLKLGVGDRITVYKANMIIPQIGENLTQSNKLEIPSACPACGGETQIREANDVQVLYCTNPKCSAKKIKAFTHFVSRDALNIEGLSEATLEKFIGAGFLQNFCDLFSLQEHKATIMEMEGFGEKSFDKLMNRIEKARKTTLPKLIYSLGIANIGLANAKMICKEFANDVEKMMEADVERLSQIEGIGEVIASTFYAYFQEESHRHLVMTLLQEIIIEQEEVKTGMLTLSGLSFAITGSLLQFENRNALKEKIESLGGKVTGSVSAKTTALINNDAASQSAKNKKAREVGAKILTEEEFIRTYLEQESIKA